MILKKTLLSVLFSSIYIIMCCADTSSQTRVNLSEEVAVNKAGQTIIDEVIQTEVTEPQVNLDEEITTEVTTASDTIANDAEQITVEAIQTEVSEPQVSLGEQITIEAATASDTVTNNAEQTTSNEVIPAAVIEPGGRQGDEGPNGKRGHKGPNCPNP